MEDVRELCTTMAILAKGRVLLQGAPADLVAHLQHKVWRALVDRNAVAGIHASHTVLSTRLLSGRVSVSVLSDASPGVGFAPAEPELEHVYFATLHAAEAQAPTQARDAH